MQQQSHLGFVAPSLDVFSFFLCVCCFVSKDLFGGCHTFLPLSLSFMFPPPVLCTHLVPTRFGFKHSVSPPPSHTAIYIFTFHPSSPSQFFADGVTSLDKLPAGSCLPRLSHVGGNWPRRVMRDRPGQPLWASL